MKNKAAKITEYCLSALVTTVSSLLVFYSVLFYVHIKDTNKAFEKSDSFKSCIIYMHSQIGKTVCFLCTVTIIIILLS